jgi:hypothetical protein
VGGARLAVGRECDAPRGEQANSRQPRDLAEAVAFALRCFEGRKRTRDADAFRAALAAERVVRHLDRAGFVVMNLVDDIRRRDGL